MPVISKMQLICKTLFPPRMSVTITFLIHSSYTSQSTALFIPVNLFIARQLRDRACKRGTAAPPFLCPCLLWPLSPISATAQLLLLQFNHQCLFLMNVNSRSRSLYAIACPSVCLPVCRLSVCNARALCSGG